MPASTNKLGCPSASAILRVNDVSLNTLPSVGNGVQSPPFITIVCLVNRKLGSGYLAILATAF
jgi:hypothetical protein